MDSPGSLRGPLSSATEGCGRCAGTGKAGGDGLLSCDASEEAVITEVIPERWRRRGENFACWPPRESISTVLPGPDASDGADVEIHSCCCRSPVRSGR